MPLPIILCMLVVISFWLSYEIKKSSRYDEKISENFWNRERNSLFVRKKDISHLTKIILPDNLPYMDTTDGNLIAIQDDMKKLNGLDIINLTGMSNTDIRMEYGAPNFDYLSICDNNYTKLSSVLNKWSTYLYEHNYTKEAKFLLEYAISINVDISNIYTTLASIYINEHMPEKISTLIDTASALNSISSSIIVKKLNDISSHTEE